jgi:nucleotide-binding universal stress UspA family protein
MQTPIAYMPLSTYPEAISNAAILAAIHFCTGLGCAVHVASFAADMPQVYTPIGDVAFDVQGLMAGAKEASAAEAKRLEALIKGTAGDVHFAYHANLGAMTMAATHQARLYDLVLMPWQEGAISVQEMAETMIFGTGRPTIMVPQTAKAGPLEHIAVAWDDSRVAARALNDALALLAPTGKISVLSAASDGDTSAMARASSLADALRARGHRASAIAVQYEGRSISAALQETAMGAGAHLLAMGGFGHSRLRDFVLGGATKGALSDVKLPVLMSH